MSKYHLLLLTNFDSIKEEEKKINTELTIFQTADWLVHIGTDFKVAICYDQENEIKGYLPLVRTKKHGLIAYHSPSFTPYFGPIILENDLTEKGEIITCLLTPFLKESHLDFMLPLRDQDLLPYLNLGFTIEARQNHIFPFTQKYTIDSLNRGKARDIKRVKKRLESNEISIVYGRDALAEIIELMDTTAKRKRFQYSQILLEKVLSSQDESRFFCIVILDKDEKPLAGAYCPKDHVNMYHLIGASKRLDDKILNLVNYLVLHICIEHANQNGLNFDFEGSNIPGVANFYRMMGGKPIIKYRLQKTRSIGYNLARSIERIKRERK